MDKQKISMINLAVSKLIPTFVEQNIRRNSDRRATDNAQDFLRAFLMPNKRHRRLPYSLIFLFAFGRIKSDVLRRELAVVLFSASRNMETVISKMQNIRFMNTFEFFDQCLGLLPASATLRGCKVRTIQGTTTVSIAYMVGSQIYRSLFEQKGGING